MRSHSDVKNANALVLATRPHPNPLPQAGEGAARGSGEGWPVGTLQWGGFRSFKSFTDILYFLIGSLWRAACFVREGGSTRIAPRGMHPNQVWRQKISPVLSLLLTGKSLARGEWAGSR